MLSLAAWMNELILKSFNDIKVTLRIYLILSSYPLLFLI